MRILTAMVLAALLGTSPSAAQTKKQLTEAEAIRIAEQFVVENGYTDLPPVTDKTRLSYEGIDSADPDQRLKNRFNTLERKAYGVEKGRTKRYNRWTVVFRYNPNNERYRRVIPNYEQQIRKVGRAVTMDADGSNIRMQHQEIYLKNLRIIRRNGN